MKIFSITIKREDLPKPRCPIMPGHKHRDKTKYLRSGKHKKRISE